MQVENIRDPAGDTQTFEPRPRPATWTVAEAVKPVGRWRSSCVFLFTVGQRMVLLEFCRFERTYFSSMVLVLVTTSPYKRCLPNAPSDAFSVD